jgi:hypothetical protein
MSDILLYINSHEWLRNLLVIALLALAYLWASRRFGGRKKKRDDLTKFINELTGAEWELEQMVLPHSGHGLAERIDEEMSAVLTMYKNGTFEAACPLNTYTGEWELTDAPTEGEKILDEPHINFDVQRTTANEGDATILRNEKYFVRMLRKTDIARAIHANTHLLLCDREGLTIGLFHEKPKEHNVIFKK